MQFQKKLVSVDDIKMRKDAFISDRKVARFAAELNGLPGVEETPAERSTSIMFLASLLVNVTVMQRMATERAVDAGTTALSTRSVRGINEVVHYIAENLRYRVAAGTPYVWPIDDCLEDYGEVAKHYGVTSILQSALELTTALFELAPGNNCAAETLRGSKMENSKINWTDHTWNPWIGCRHVSAECDHCYADDLVTNRMGRDFSIVQRTKTWKEPPKWNRKAPALAAEMGRRVRVFCASLTDFFIQDADQWRDEAWDVIRRCTEMDWLILTKRPQLIERRLPADWGQGWPHVWLGTTCGVRGSYPRLDALRNIPAAVRFISAEPLLESLADINLDGFHWLIAGGESGSGFRPMQEGWALELRDICARDRVGFHFKQHSAFRPGQGAELDGKMHHEPPLVQIDDSSSLASPIGSFS